MNEKLQFFLEHLGKKQLLLFTGKGGAGKSAASVLTAIALARIGKKVLLVELGRKEDEAFSRLHEMLHSEPLKHEPIEAQPNLWACKLSPAQSLAEYVGLKIHTTGLASLLINNKVTASFLEVVPGLTEIVTMGKLWHSLTEEKKYDIIIIDGPASGHSYTLLKSPENFAKLTKRGPLFKDAIGMQSFFTDAEKTAVIFVSIAESMSVDEACEYFEKMNAKFSMPFLVINKCFPKPPKSSAWKTAPEILQKAYAYAKDRNHREQESLEAVKIPKNWNIIKIPFVFSNPNKTFVENFSQAIEDSTQ